MFLSSMRTGVFSGVFLAILLLGGVGLILSDRSNFFHDGFSKTDVIVVDGRPVKTAEFDRLVRSTLQSQRISPTDAYKAGYIDRIVQNQVMMRLLHKSAYDMGIIADDKNVADELKKALAAQGGDPKEALAAELKAQGISEASFVELFRSNLSIDLLKKTIGEGLYVPESMSRAFYEWNMEERSISYVTLPQSAIKIDPPSDAALEKFYETVKPNYAIPESRDVTVGIIDPATLAAKVEITDEKIKKYYDDNKSEFETPDMRTVEQSVLKTEKEANDVLAAAKISKDLKTATVKVTSKADAFIKGSNYDEKSLPDSLAKPVFTAKVDDIIGPVQTPLGWHVAKITALQKAGMKPLADVKDGIRKELSENGTSDAQYEITNQIEDRLTNGETLQTMADEYKMKLVVIKNINAGATSNDALKEFDKGQAKILQAAFSTNEKESSALSDLPGGKMFTVHVDALRPTKFKDLKDVKAEVATKWTELEKRHKMLENAIETTARLDDKKTTLADVAKANGGSIKTAKIVRGNAPPTGFTAQNISQIMTSDTSKAIAIPVADGVQIVTVDHVTLPEKAPSASELSNIDKNLKLDLQEERFVSFINHLERNTKVVINKDLIEQMYGEKSSEQE